MWSVGIPSQQLLQPVFKEFRFSTAALTQIILAQPNEPFNKWKEMRFRTMSITAKLLLCLFLVKEPCS